MAVMAMAGALASAVEPSFQGLGDLPGGDFRSRALGVSGDGSVVVGGSAADPGDGPFRWTQQTGMVGLGCLPGYDHGHAAAASRDGSVVVGASSLAGYGSEAFRWTLTDPETGAGTMESLGLLPGSYASVPCDVSGDGAVAVGYGVRHAPEFSFEAFRWTRETGIVGLRALPEHFCSEGRGASDDGLVLVGTSSGERTEAFRWTEETGLLGLGHLPGGHQSWAHGISPDGAVVLGCAGVPWVGIPAVLWHADAQIVELGWLPSDPDAEQAVALAASVQGKVVVGESGYYVRRAFIWDAASGMRDLKEVLTNDCGLDLTGWTLTCATDISYDGTVIVGYGTHPNSDTEAWRAVIPEPVTLALLALGALAALRRRES